MKSQNVVNPQFPHRVTITRVSESDSPFDDTESTSVIYDGEGRSYTNTTTFGDGVVAENKRKTSIPVLYKEWRDSILFGDRIRIVKNRLVEEGIVRDFEPCNFGSMIYWEIIRQ